MRIFFFSFFLLFFLSDLSAQLLYAISDDEELYRLDLSNCSTELITPVDLRMTDIAFHPNGNLYGIRFSGEILQIDMETGETDLIYTFTSELPRFNSLTISIDEVIYAAMTNGDLFSFDLTTNSEEFIGNAGYGANGDLTFYQGNLYLGATETRIVLIDRNELSNNSVVMNDSFLDDIYGFSTFNENCNESSYIVSFDNDDISSGVYQVDWNTNTFDLTCDFDLGFLGSASPTEYLSSIPRVIQDIVLTQTSCTDNDGSISIIASGDADQLSYSIDGVNFQPNGIFENIGEGSYTVTVIDSFGCPNLEEVEIETTDPPEFEIIITESTSCEYDNWSISIFSIGGVGEISYSIDGVNFQSNDVFENLSEGTYTVSMIDLNGCTNSQEFQIETTEPIELENISINNTSCGNNNGSIFITANGGVGDLSYSINGTGFQSTSIFEDLKPGAYTVMAIDQNGCMAMRDVNILSSTALNLVRMESFPSNCGESNGGGLFYFSGKTDDIQIIINGANYFPETTINDLPCGEYNVQVIGDNCTIDTVLNVGQNDCAIYIPNAFSPNADGKNDDFKIYPHPLFKGVFLDFKIFGRWGELIYEIKNFEADDLRWNGTFKGEYLDIGVYVYYLEYQLENGRIKSEKGDVTIVK